MLAEAVVCWESDKNTACRFNPISPLPHNVTPVSTLEQKRQDVH